MMIQSVNKTITPLQPRFARRANAVEVEYIRGMVKHTLGETYVKTVDPVRCDVFQVGKPTPGPIGLLEDVALQFLIFRSVGTDLAQLFLKTFKDKRVHAYAYNWFQCHTPEAAQSLLVKIRQNPGRIEAIQASPTDVLIRVGVSRI